MYVEESLNRDGKFTEALENDTKDVRMVLGMGEREARDMAEDIKVKVYRCGRSHSFWHHGERGGVKGTGRGVVHNLCLIECAPQDAPRPLRQ